MLYKSFLSSVCIFCMSACSSSTNIQTSSSNGETIVAISPTSGKLILNVMCNLKTNEPTVVLVAEQNSDNRPKFVWDKKETSYASIIKLNKSLYNAQDSRDILQNLNSSNKLEINTTHGKYEYNTGKLKTSIKAHLSKCM